MKKIIVLLMSIMTIFLVSCSKNEYLELAEIKESQIFTQEEDTYYVYFHKPDCSGCETAKTDVLHYNYLSSKKGLIKIYGMNLYNEDNVKSFIYRKYDGEDGQGDDKQFFVDGVKEWNNLYIPGTPALILINIVNGRKEAKFVCQGASKIIKYLGELE